MGLFDDLLNVVPFKKKLRTGGNANTPTHNPQQRDQVLTVPRYLDHLEDIFTSRQVGNALELVDQFAQHDPDVSSAVNGYLTLANTEMVAYAVDVEGSVDAEASRSLHKLIQRLSSQTDYTQGFVLKQSLDQIVAELRYMVLIRGALGVELVPDKAGLPDTLRNVDMKSIRWLEKNPGEYKPAQVVPGKSDPVPLDTPSFFVSFYRRDPTKIYTASPFVSVINTVAARQQVINDLYRIMRFTGYPRMEVKVIEEVLLNNAPPAIRNDQTKIKEWVAQRIAEIQQQFSDIRADQSLVHTDAVELNILNGRKSGAAIDIQPVITVLNAQNQAALKTMATILGRGESGVNTGSVEARLAAMFADELNGPISDLLQRIFSFCLHQQGFPGFAVVYFRAAEMRPETELEPQFVLKANRLRQDLSDGIISDAEYTLEMYGRLPNPDAPPLSGTGFMTPAPAPNAADVPPGSDPVSKSASGEKKGETNARSSTKTNQPKRAA